MNLKIHRLAQGLLISTLLSTCGTGIVDGDNAATGTGNVSISVAQQSLVTASHTFILSGIDDRRCPAPACGGYFVKSVNLTSTPCADGTSASECHALRLDFGPSGLSAAEADGFERESFAVGAGLVQGSLYQLPPLLGASHGEDVLLVTGAWAGQARSIPKGSFSRLKSTGKLCITFPCDSFEGTRLNTSQVRSYNGVGLATAGAPAEAVARAQQALIHPGILAAGVELLIAGPAGRGKDFAATEFYLPLVGCAAEDAQGVGACATFLGYKWDGAACVPVSGCSCEGAACAGLPTSLAACKGEHVICATGCGQPGRPTCGDKQYCDFPEAYACGAAAQPGECRSRPEICAAISRPVCACNGKTYANACTAHAAGVDVASTSACK